MLATLFTYGNLLAVKWDVNPYIFRFGEWGLRWYGLLFIIGFFPIGYGLFMKFYKREQLPAKLLDPLLYVLIISALTGARLGHIFFYEREFYMAHPEEILKVWHGGLASHGGAIAILFGIWWYVGKYGKKYGFGYMWLMDRLAIAIPFAGMCIRLGNLMNSEIYGYETTLPWGFIFVRNGETLPHHPTQLYEALAYLFIGLLALALYYTVKYKEVKLQPVNQDNLNKSKKSAVRKTDDVLLTSGRSGIYRGFLFGLFLTLLFTARFLIETVKLPQEGEDPTRLLNNGQVLSIPFIIVGIVIVI